MVKDSIVEETAINSPLKAASTIKPKSGGLKKLVLASVMLTPLIDAFSILVIYLLVNFSSSGELLYMDKETELPQAQVTEVLNRNTVVQLKNEKIFIENKEIPAADLVASLIEVRKSLRESEGVEGEEPALTIQADRRIKYEFLNQVVLASSHAGFSDIHFAVLQN